MDDRTVFLARLEREAAVTQKILDAFPAEKADFRPHERSSPAKMLAWMFTAELGLIEMAIAGPIDFSKGIPSAPATWEEIVQAYGRRVSEVRKKVAALTEAEWNGKRDFPVGPGKMEATRLGDIAWFMMMDGVHHRGQLSVYLRMAGGKVPAIYGPSADEPWR